MKTKTFITIVAATMLAACSSNDNETDNWAGEIRLSSGLEVQQTTRSIATDLQGTQIASGVHVGFFINESVASGTTVTTTYPQNLDYTADGNGAFSGAAVYYPQNGTGVNIYAYAPKTATASLDGSYVFTVATNQSTSDDYLASDLLWGQPMKLKSGSTTDYETANPVARTKDNVNVSFKHLLSKVEVTLTAGSGLTVDDLKGATLKIMQLLPTTTMTLNAGVLSTASGAKTDITAATYAKDATPTAFTATAIIVPQTITKDTKFLQLHLAAGGDLYYTLPSGDLTLASGKIYKYTITANLTGLAVTSSISDWASIGTSPTTGTAEME